MIAVNNMVLKSAAQGILGLGIWIAGAIGIAAQQAPSFVEPWGAVFAEETAVFHVRTGGEPLGWSLALSGAVVARGENTAIEQTFPPLRDGVVAAGNLTAETSQGQGTKPIWLFSRKPGFPAMEKMLLFDPMGATAALLESNGISFQPVNAVDALAGAKGVLMVGEGISPDEYKGLAGTLYDAALRGARILWLAPGEGRMALPDGEENSKPAVDFRDASIVSAMDKRLHAEDWRGGKPVASAFQLTGDRRVVEVEWNAVRKGWCWMDVRWPGGGRLTLCGLSIVEAWEDNPAPRYLLAQWLTDLNKQE